MRKVFLDTVGLLAVSFVLMRREGITEAFTNDEHFRAAGYVALF